MKTERKKSPSKFLPKPQFFYDLGTRRFWTQDTRGCWININEASLRRHLVAAGFNPIAKKAERLSGVEREISRIQLECGVWFAGPLAGYRQGVHEVCGNRILVTTSPKLIEPASNGAPSQFPVLAQILDGMFNDPARDQRPLVYGWLKQSLEALTASQLRPAQVLALAGPRNTFKSSFQNLITLIFGGRPAKPYRYMAGLTQFNKDLFGAEHLLIEDEIASTSIKNRRHFAARIKDFTVNEVQSCHAKGRDGLSLRPFWRVTISLNDEPEALLILPPIDEGLADKITLLKVKQFTMPMPTATLEERDLLWKTLVAELPAFLAFLVSWQIPGELVSQRFGITHYHHPDILSAIDALAPETRLLALIDAVIFAGGVVAPQWVGTAVDLEQILVMSNLCREARKLLDWDNSTGTYLGRLATKSPNRVQQARSSQSRDWIIHSPKHAVTA